MEVSNPPRASVKSAPIVAAAVLLVVVGLVQGWWTGRWGSAGAALKTATASLGKLPLQIGDWKGQEVAMDPRENQAAGFTGCVRRRYVHSQTNQSVEIMLACGPPGPVSVHTPEICFVGAGCESLGAAARAAVRSGDGSTQQDAFWVADFSRPSVSGAEYIRVFYAWNAGRVWAAPDYPRPAFASSPFLYKLYLVRAVNSPQEPHDRDPALSFARQLLPVLTQTLQHTPS